MIDGTFVPLLLAGVPLLGALISLVIWLNPDRLKLSSIIWSVISLGAMVRFSSQLVTPPEGLLPLYLLPLAAVVSILGQPVHEDHRLSWIMTLVCLGLGVGTLTGRDLSGHFFLMALFASIMLLLYRHHTALWPISWWGIGLFALGVVCTGISFVSGPPLSSVASLLTCAILLPLVPFHKGYLTALTRLPGSLPPFIVLLLPVVGLHGLSSVMPTVPDVVSWIVSVFALAGALYGAIKALAQSRVRLLLAYGSLSFFSMLWWFAAATRTVTLHAALLVGAVGLATSGLLIAWQVIRTRYGDDVDPQAISGLASAMPQYAVLFSLLALAAIGLPPFGVFAGFMGLLLTSPLPSSVGLFITLIAWFAASWYIMQMVQQLLFGAQRPDLRYTDLLTAEFASLLMLVLALLALGLAPASLFASDQTTYQTIGVAESLTWNK
ncbi:MAG: proton-conducting transporter transmembrane domain-containing protein [Nitrospiraceae bacterium]